MACPVSIHSSLEYPIGRELLNLQHRVEQLITSETCDREKLKATSLKAKDRPLGMEIAFLSLPALAVPAQAASGSCEVEMLVFGKPCLEPH